MRFTLHATTSFTTLAIALASLCLPGCEPSSTARVASGEIKPGSEPKPNVLTFSVGQENGEVVGPIVIKGLTPADLSAWKAAIEQHETSREPSSQLPRVEVATEAGAVAPSMLGSWRVDGESLIFEPSFPFRRGLTYRVVYPADVVPGTPQSAAPPVVFTFSVPKPTTDKVAKVVAVYPTSDELPENQLKFYLHFSTPMSRGEVYRRVHLFDSTGREVERPFLQLGEELWDNSGTRLTLLFDPGRVKRGLKPREEDGPILEAGKSYEFVIDADWPDAAGNSLFESFRKEFKATAADTTQPNLEEWKLDLPAAGTTDPLTIHFPEPLDHAMLERVVNIQDPQDAGVEGSIEIDERETRWTLRPKQAWAAGQHKLIVDSAIEDLAGNCIDHQFEVDTIHPTKPDAAARTTSREFELVPKP